MLAAEPGGWQGTAAPAGPGSPGGERGGRSAGRDGGGGKLQVTPALRRSGGPAQVAGSPLRNREHILPEGLAARPAFGRGHRFSSGRARCCHPAAKTRGEGWRGQPVLPEANGAFSLPNVAVSVCV